MRKDIARKDVAGGTEGIQPQGRSRAAVEEGVVAHLILHSVEPARRVSAGLEDVLLEDVVRRVAGLNPKRRPTFPGLDETWVRIAVRDPDVTAKLLATIRSAL